MGINTATAKFKEDLVDLINKSGLPPCVVKMVMESTLAAVQIKERLAMQAEAESEVTKDAESVQPDSVRKLSIQKNAAE